jgi:hypothetical protein
MEDNANLHLLQVIHFSFPLCCSSAYFLDSVNFYSSLDELTDNISHQRVSKTLIGKFAITVNTNAANKNSIIR